MEAKDILVRKSTITGKLFDPYSVHFHELEHQAEISFKAGQVEGYHEGFPDGVKDGYKAGQREVVEWIENNGLFWRSISITNRDYYIPLALADAWQAFRKERGL